MQLVSSLAQYLRSVKAPVWTISTDRTRLQGVRTASGLQIIMTEPLTQLFYVSINMYQLPHVGTFYSPHLKEKAWKAQGKISGQHLSTTNMEKLAGMWRKVKLSDLLQTYMKHFSENLFPKTATFYTFRAMCSPLTINYFPCSSFLTFIEKSITCYSPGTYSSPLEFQSALALIEKNLKISVST